jgi:hypothetical protein
MTIISVQNFLEKCHNKMFLRDIAFSRPLFEMFLRDIAFSHPLFDGDVKFCRRIR